MNSSPTNLIDDLRLLQAPQPLPMIVWVGLVVLLLAVICLILWRRSHAQRQEAPSAKVMEEAREDALAELQKLRGLLTKANSRVYAIQVSGIVRRYIERRFGLRAPKRSTEEFLFEARASQRLDERHQRNLGTFLASCDFLKFARASAEASELEQMHEAAVRFVADTQESANTNAATSKAQP